MITPLVFSNSSCLFLIIILGHCIVHPLRYLITDLVSSSFSYHLISIMVFSLHLILSKLNYVEYLINHVYNLLIYDPVIFQYHIREI